ncbi:MerR family transcriptional regulator [Nonomuraea rhodomycinica]|uniref:MerR family transcriptional regulator n=2 Tax=Nonomuraea rhodomycinica TaxID=1712872 RepID=A0A7Y6IMU7_9ACTN|nr:MerR family transcriptional regulator [Nonomuraea rhodomycinica]
MRMAELSTDTGVPVPTIKYYLREGLLPPGRPVGRNQADYGPEHVRRLKLVRALAEYGGLSIAAIGELVRHLDDPEISDNNLLGLGQLMVTARQEPLPGPHVERARRALDELCARRGWKDMSEHPAYATLVGVMASLEDLGHEAMLASLPEYAEAAELIAEADMRVVGELGDRERTLEVVVLGTLMGDTLLTALRRLAQANVALRRYGPK